LFDEALPVQQALKQAMSVVSLILHATNEVYSVEHKRKICMKTVKANC